MDTSGAEESNKKLKKNEKKEAKRLNKEPTESDDFEMPIKRKSKKTIESKKKHYEEDEIQGKRTIEELSFNTSPNGPPIELSQETEIHFDLTLLLPAHSPILRGEKLSLSLMGDEVKDMKSEGGIGFEIFSFFCNGFSKESKQRSPNSDGLCFRPMDEWPVASSIFSFPLFKKLLHKNHQISKEREKEPTGNPLAKLKIKREIHWNN
ncbi:hypothetical protein L6452_19656 [Arctium lappa]|uniref:Uncharacterized protein n=1 Tax=Arctium lappa TaxID=4217 RepID=A0ACB9B8N8_ARCLA|nr:hypothetical protein L6452_19656 [Arctium lappa]